MRRAPVWRSLAGIAASLGALALAVRAVALLEPLAVLVPLFALVIVSTGLLLAHAGVVQPPPASIDSTDPAPWCPIRRAALVVAVAGMVATSLAANALLDGRIDAVVVLAGWIVSMAALVLAAGLGRSWLARQPPSDDPLDGWLAWSVVALAAFLPRIVALDRFPTVLDSDESAFILLALQAEAGELPNPWAPGWFTNPNSYSVIQGYVTRFAGDDVIGYRFVSAIAGGLSVIATWRLGRRVVGPLPALAGALVLAALPLHLHLSRVAVNNIVDALAVATALLFLLRAIASRHPVDAVTCGYALGIGFYGYFGGRAFPIVVLATLLILAVDRRLGAGTTFRLAGWIVAGFVAMSLPLLVSYWHAPDQFGAHLSRVSALSPGDFFHAPRATVRHYGIGLIETLVLPVRGTANGYFRHEAPYLGWAAAWFVTLGVAAWTGLAWRNRSLQDGAALLAPWGLIAAGVALTAPVLGHRLLAASPLMALAAGSGIVVMAELAGLVAGHMRGRRVVVVALTVVLAGALAVHHIAWWATDDRLHETYGDPRTTAAWDLGWRISSVDTETLPPFVIAGAPYMFAGGFHNLTYLTRGVTIGDIMDTVTHPSDLSSLGAGTVVILVPERLDERCAIEPAFGAGTFAEAYDRQGNLLYILFSPEPETALPVGFSPAGTYLVERTSSSCPASPP